MVAEGRYAGAPAVGRLTFEAVRPLKGDVSDTIMVVAPFATAQTLQLGAAYIFAYTERARSPVAPKEWVRNPQGPMLVVKTGLEPAVLPANDELRQLLEKATDREFLRSKQYLGMVMEGLDHNEPSLQRLFAAELMGRKALRSQLTGSSKLQLSRFVRAQVRDPLAREYVLAAAKIYAPALGTWWSEAAAEILRDEPVSPTPSAANEVLIWTAFSVLADNQLPLPPETAERWIRSGNGALAEQGLLAIRRNAPEKEREAAERALALPELDVGTRSFLEDHLRRLKLSSPPTND